jgi:hypothetical protein
MVAEHDCGPVKHLLLPGVCFAFFLSGCTPMRAEQVAAVIDVVDSASRAELQRVVSEALAVDRVELAQNALTDTDILTVARKRHTGIEVGILDSRSEDTPDQFRLRLSGDDCMLQHVASGRDWLLAATRCRPLD